MLNYFRNVLIASTIVIVMNTFSVQAFSQTLPGFADSPPVDGLDVKETELRLFRLSEQLLQDPQNPQLLLQKGIFLSDLGRLQAAYNVFDALRVAFPDQAAPHVNLAAIHARWGRLEDARIMLMKSSALQNDRFQTHLSLAAVNVGLALEALVKARDLNPGDKATQRRLDALQKYIDVTLETSTGPASQAGVVGVAPTQRSRAAPGKKDQSSANREPLKTREPAKPSGNKLRLENLDLSEEEPVSAPITSQGSSTSGDTWLQADVLTALQSWVKAWNAKSYDAYLSHYSTSFVPADGVTFDSWRERKKALMENAKFIRVEINVMDARFQGPIATVRVQQTYQSNRYSDKSRKEVRLRLEEGQWRLLSEQVVN
jgi:tetratricopeptide (TPR) repeat protein